MSVFDEFFLSVFKYYKTKMQKRANVLAIFYISFLQIALLLVLGIFFATFFNQMNVDLMSTQKAWVLFGFLIPAIYFKNWLQYSGKKRMEINAKMSKRRTQTHNIWLLWSLPFACIALALIIMRTF